MKLIFLIICGVLFTGIVWFFQRETTSQQTIKVYKTTPTSNLSEETDSHTHAQGIPHGFHAEETPHPHSHERPSDFMIKLIKERLNEDPDPKVERWLAYVESEEGRAFFESFPSSDEWYEKSKSFGFFQDTPGILAARHDVYRKYFPTGTVEDGVRAALYCSAA